MREVTNPPPDISGGAGVEPRSHSQAHTHSLHVTAFISPRVSHKDTCINSPTHLDCVCYVIFKIFDSAGENQKHKQE